MTTYTKSLKVPLAILILSLALASVAVAQAEEVSTDANGSADNEIVVQPPAPPKPPIGQRIKANMENRLEKNREVRNIEINRKSSTTPPLAPKGDRPEQMMLREKASTSMMLRANASTSMMLFKKNNGERKEVMKKMEMKVFEIRKNALVHELTIALKNLETASARIESRITKAEGEGKDMAASRALLVTAQASLAKAKTEVAAFEALSITTPGTGASASTTAEVELTRPRALGDAAIKSVKEARDAMKKVVESIAKALGVKIEAGAEVKATVN